VTAIAGLALLAVVVMAALGVWYLSDRGGYESLPGYSPTITRASVFITLSLVTGLVLLAVQAYRDRQLRRVVAVLWDVITFWPRANHPLTPPCYAERTVPELLDRLKVLLADADTRVLIAAHSQGTVIAAATLLQHDDDNRNRVALLTFGSPLRRLYARNFPAYFGTDALPRLRQRQRRRWINLWALTDPIGSWVNDMGDRSLQAALTDVDHRLLDAEQLTQRSDGTFGPICGHSGFWTRPEYSQATGELDAALLPEGAPTDTTATAPPTEKYL
jgi:pimeloyl-ACP methyl ester carboxylesterase